MKIKLENKEYPVAFGMAAFRDLKKRTGMDIPQIQEVFAEMEKHPEKVGVDEVEKVAEFLLSGIRNGCRKAKEEEPTLTVDDMLDLMDDTEQFEKIMAEYANESKVDSSKN